MGIHDAEKHLRSIRDTPNRDAENLRVDIIFGLQKARRMVQQLTRLRDIQIEHVKEIGMCERVRLKLQRHGEIQKLIADGDRQQMEAKIQSLQEDASKLQSQIKEIEGSLHSNAGASSSIIEQLRLRRDEFSPETVKMRERSVSHIREEEQQKMHLATLRSEKMQDVKLVAMLKAALAE